MAMQEDLAAGMVGGAAGIAATVSMSVLMVAAREAGLMPRLPPHDIADAIVEHSPLDDAVQREGRNALGWVLHLAFGASSGALYALLRPRLMPRWPGPLAGVGYALMIWTVSYLGWVPALRILPSAVDDRPGRPAAMIAAHVVFGLVLGALVDRSPRRDVASRRNESGSPSISRAGRRPSRLTSRLAAAG